MEKQARAGKEEDISSKQFYKSFLIATFTKKKKKKKKKQF